MREIASSRKPLLPLLLFHFLCLHLCHVSYRHDVPNWRTQRSDLFGMEGAKMTARKPATMAGGVCLLAILPSKNTLPTTQQRLSTRRDLNGRQRPPWCPTPGAATNISQPACWLIFVCGGAGSGAPWRPWDNGGSHGQWGMV